MKKIIALLVVFSSYSAISQTSKGKILLGPTINFRQSTSDNDYETSPDNIYETKRSQLNASLRLGYFVADNVAVGLIGGFSNSTFNETNNNVNFQNTNKTKTNLGSFGVFARAYKLFNENRFGFFGELYATYGIGNTESNFISKSGLVTTENKASTKIGILNTGIRPGFVFFINDKLGFEASVGEISFNSQKNENSSAGQKISTSRNNDLNINFGWNYVNLGFHFYLGKKKE